MTSSASSIPTVASPDLCTFTLMIEGTEVSGEFEVLSIEVSKALNRISSATIELRDGEASQSTFRASNTEHFIPGKRIEIHLGYRSQNQPVFKGMVIKHSIKVRKNETLLVIECRDETIRLSGDAKSRYFTDVKDSDIIQTILGEYDLQAEVETTTAQLPDVVQYEMSDWDFIMCRAESSGLVAIIDAGRPVIKRPVTGAEPVVSVAFGASLLELDAEIDARLQSKALAATSWNAADQERIEAEAVEPTATQAGNIGPEELAGVMGVDTRLLKHGGGLDQSELQSWADARLLRDRLAKVRGRARFQGFPEILPGSILEITGIGERFAGKMYVSGVRHFFADGNWETDAQLGLTPEVFAQTYAIGSMPAGGLLAAVCGLQIGLVTALEGDPLGQGRIKTTLPMIDGAAEGLWARLATLDAGKERGTFFRPEIGDEVILGFLNDDPRFPVILGALHGEAHAPPEPASDENHRKGYVSREKSKLIFDDEKKSIQFETPAGNRITLSDDQSGIVLQDQNGNTITLNEQGIVIESGKDLVLKAAKDIRIESQANLNLAAQASFKAAGTASAEVSGASTTIKGSATTVIQGGIVQIN